jgi:hypothetical protein
MPFFRSKKDREYWLDLAFFGNEEVTSAIEYEGNAGQFTLHCLGVLRKHGDVDGRPATCRPLETVGSQQGVTVKQTFNELAAALEGKKNSAEDV